MPRPPSPPEARHHEDARQEFASQADLQGLIESLTTQREELRTQQLALAAAQRELEASRDVYAELYDFAPVPILTLGSDGLLQSLNLAAVRLLGVERARALGAPLLDHVHDSSRRAFLDHMTRCRHESDLVRSEIILRGRDGQDVAVEIQSKRYESSSGQPVVYQTVLTDLTERRRTEEERRRIRLERERIQHEEVAARAASEAKDHFLAVLSHELRTPLAPILLTLESLHGHDTGSPQVRRALAMIRRNTEILTRLIDDLLDVTRIVHDKLHLVKVPVSLHAVLSSVVELCQTDMQAADIKLGLQLDASDPYVSGDAIRLRQIFWNLLKNAVQHSPRGARVTLRTEKLGPHAMRVAVTDLGAGIEREELDRVFEPFQQAHMSNRTGSGLGLGLAICRGLVEAHGGTIRAISAGVDSGATFVVELPSCAAPKRVEAPQLDAPTHCQPLRILVIEDHEDTAEAMRIMLTRNGYDVRLAGSLDEGRRLAEQPFDVLLSDLQLPDGSGLDLMRELSAKGPVRGIAMSGFGTDKDMLRSREAGFHLHLVKPVEIAHVIEAIESLGRR